MNIKKIINQDGYALVEIITSITILAIVVTAISGVFLSSYNNINNSGKSISTLYQNQQTLEGRIANNIGTYTNIEIDFPSYSYGPVSVQLKKAEAGPLTVFFSH